MPEILIYLAIILLSAVFGKKKKPKPGSGKPARPQRRRESKNPEMTEEQPGESIEDILAEMMGRKKKPTEPQPEVVVFEEAQKEEEIQEPYYPTYDEEGLREKQQRYLKMDVEHLTKKKYTFEDDAPMLIHHIKGESDLEVNVDLEDMIIAQTILTRKYC